MNRFDKIAVVAIYAAMMLGFAWVVGLFVPSLSRWLMETFGIWPIFFLIVTMIAAGWFHTYRSAGRAASGKSLDP